MSCLADRMMTCRWPALMLAARYCTSPASCSERPLTFASSDTRSFRRPERIQAPSASVMNARKRAPNPPKSFLSMLRLIKSSAFRNLLQRDGNRRDARQFGRQRHLGADGDVAGDLKRQMPFALGHPRHRPRALLVRSLLDDAFFARERRAAGDHAARCALCRDAPAH